MKKIIIFILMSFIMFFQVVGYAQEKLVLTSGVRRMAAIYIQKPETLWIWTAHCF